MQFAPAKRIVSDQKLVGNHETRTWHCLLPIRPTSLICSQQTHGSSYHLHLPSAITTNKRNSAGCHLVEPCSRPMSGRRAEHCPAVTSTVPSIEPCRPDLRTSMAAWNANLNLHTAEGVGRAITTAFKHQGTRHPQQTTKIPTLRCSVPHPTSTMT